MKRAYFIAAVCAALSAALSAAPTANEDFVIAEAAAAYTNAVAAATNYTDAAIAAAEPDFSTGNTQLVATIEATAPAPGDYAAVSNAAMSALQEEVDPAFTLWVDAATNESGYIYHAYLADNATSAEYATEAGSASDYVGGGGIAASFEHVLMAIPTSVSQLSNDAGYLTPDATNGVITAETDPTVPAWAKAESAPMPGNYATVSNRAMTAVQTETDPHFTAWADAHLVNDGSMVDWARDAIYAQYLGDATAPVKYSAADITAISNGFAAADSSLASRLSLASLAATNYTDEAIGAAIAPANPTFSNAVLSVGFGIDTNAVAVLNEIAADFGGFPLTPGSTATTVGGLLAALAAAIAWLKKNKADAAALRYAFAATIQPTAGTAAPTGSLTDRAGNKVVCTEATGQTGDNAKLTLTLPPAVSGYMRDFLVKIDRTTSGCYSVDFVPYGNESISYETEDGSMPEVPDGAVTWLSFTESESGGVFTVRAIPLVAVTGGS